MAHILDDDEGFVGKAVSAPPISDLSRAAWGQLRDAYKLARIGDPASVRSWQRFAETDEATARLVAADVAVADDQDAAARRRVEKRLRKAEDRVFGKGKKSKARRATPGVTKGEASVVPVLSGEWFDGLEKMAAADPDGGAAFVDPAGWRREIAEHAVLREMTKSGDPGRREFARKKLYGGGAVVSKAGGAGASDAEYVAYVKRAAESGDPHARRLCAEHGWGW